MSVGIHKFFRTLQTFSIVGLLKLAETLRPPELMQALADSKPSDRGRVMCAPKGRGGVIKSAALVAAVALLLAGGGTRITVDVSQLPPS
jgi:hypothetical protein